MNKGLYLHIPFCKSKCHYCSFNSFSGISFLQEEYKNALIKGIKGLNRDTLGTVYIGGGTPSVLKDEYMQEILNVVTEHFFVKKDAEITIEVNPATIDLQKIKTYKVFGINRISMGVQTMNDNELKLIGRAHTREDAIKSYDIIRSAGIDNVSLDLMYALPNQTQESLLMTIEQMIKLNPEHISCYGLSIDEGTKLFEELNGGKITAKSDEEYLDMYNIIRGELSKNGFCHYEISNFSKPGYQARHNSSYWRGDEYYAMGAGASGYINGERFIYTEDVREFISNPNKYTVEEKLTQDDKMSEFVILGLRLLEDGVNKDEFERRFSKSIYDVYKKEIEKNLSLGMLEDLCDRIRLTERAYYVSNAVLAEFIK